MPNAHEKIKEEDQNKENQTHACTLKDKIAKKYEKNIFG